MSVLPCREGTWFGVTLSGGGFARGVVARMGPKGRVLLGYFFGPRLEALPSIDQLDQVEPGTAMLVQRFGDLYLVNGRWPILGDDDQWQREHWPMPVFGRCPEFESTGWRVEYQNGNPSSVPWETRIPLEEARKLPGDALFGAGVVESRLDRLLGGSSQRPLRSRIGSLDVWHYLYFKDSETAQRVGRRLEADGYRSLVRESAPDWLVRVQHAHGGSDAALGAIEQKLSALAEAEGGEYDGWERETEAGRLP